MATIVSSVATADAVAQKDGRRHVREVHTDSLGATYEFTYLAEVGADTAAIAAARAPGILPGVQRRELSQTIAGNLSLASIRYSTAAELRAAIRALYKDARGRELARLATWIANRIDAGEVTDAQLQAAFAITAPQWATLKARMQTLRTEFADLEAAAGQ